MSRIVHGPQRHVPDFGDLLTVVKWVIVLYVMRISRYMGLLRTIYPAMKLVQ
jgi:hypothetical protein